MCDRELVRAVNSAAGGSMQQRSRWPALLPIAVFIRRGPSDRAVLEYKSDVRRSWRERGFDWRQAGAVRIEWNPMACPHVATSAKEHYRKFQAHDLFDIRGGMPRAPGVRPAARP